MRNLKFSKTVGVEFSSALKTKINQYFKTTQKSRYGNRSMIAKTVIMLLLFFGPLTIIDIGIVSSPLILFLLFIMSGLGMAGIGMGIMHDALHGSYSSSPRVNKIMGYTMNLIGANEIVWKIQHNVLHHTYPNVDRADDDINTPFFLRFSPHTKRYWLHRYQHIYIWLFYGLSTISWITSKDFVRIIRYRKLGFLPGPGELRRSILNIIGWKLFYYSYALVLPLLMVPLAPWIIILAFLSMHFVTGTLISIVFQTAHIMPDNEFPLPDKNGLIANNWHIHQLATTSNYSPGNKVLSWLIGGLNYQIEHHLLPHVCHVHYRKLSGIVAETAQEFGIAYRTNKTFSSAIWDHIKMLRQLGRCEPLA
jgi:linoleoyl-CoA desaturase